MLLCNTSVIGQEEISFIRIRDNRIVQVGGNKQQPLPEKDEIVIDCSGMLVFPGLINSHDHLDFNLFPRIGNRIYSNYQEWGKDIHLNNREAITSVLAIPSALRVQWGLYKNLLNGVTTVVNHGAKLAVPFELITVLQDSYPLHSVAFEKNWKWKLNSPFRRKLPFVMHIGEGTDTLSRKEVEQLIRWNLMKRKIIGVHGVAMTARHASAFDALVWCPASNHFLLEKTAPIDEIKSHTTILFGTDSTLTSDWNLWQQLRCARKENLLSDKELFDTITRSPAKIWGQEFKGRIGEGLVADIVIARSKLAYPSWDSFYSIEPADILLVRKDGSPVLIDAGLYYERQELAWNGNKFSAIELNGLLKYVKGDLPVLIKQIRRYYPLNGFPVSYSN